LHNHSLWGETTTRTVDGHYWLEQEPHLDGGEESVDRRVLDLVGQVPTACWDHRILLWGQPGLPARFEELPLRLRIPRDPCGPKRRSALPQLRCFCVSGRRGYGRGRSRRTLAERARRPAENLEHDQHDWQKDAHRSPHDVCRSTLELRFRPCRA